MSKLGSVKYQITSMFNEMKDFGTKRHEIKSDNYENYKSGKVDSYNPIRGNEKIQGRTTFKSYLNICIKAGEFMKSTYGIRDMSQVTPTHLAKYLNARMNDGLRTTSVNTYASALVKGFGLNTVKDIPIKLDPKSVDEVWRNRGKKDHHEKFNTEKHRSVIDAAIGTGMRRNELSNLKPYMISEKLHNGEMRVFVSITDADKEITKGAKTREILVLREYGQHILNLKEGKEPTQKIFDKITTKINIHEYGRRVYAQKMYEELKKDHGEDLTGRNKYTTRIAEVDDNGKIKRDEDGNKILKDEQKSYDRKHLKTVSEYLGHNRAKITAESYLER